VLNTGFNAMGKHIIPSKTVEDKEQQNLPQLLFGDKK
jgi:hypothetical protein